MKYFGTFILALLISFSAFSQAPQKQDINVLPGHVICKIKPEYKSVMNKGELLDVLSDYSVEKISKIFPQAKAPAKKTNIHGNPLVDISSIYEIAISNTRQTHRLINDLQTLESIEYAQPHYLPELLYEPDDPLQTEQYFLSNIRAYDAWDICKGDTNVIIGITDTGIDIDHQDLIYNIAYNTDDPLDGIDNDNDGFTDNFRGWDVGDNDNNPQCDNNQNHGTYVSGLAAPSTDNGIGISGAGFKCRILPVKISDFDGILTHAYEGIVYAADHGSDIINCAWGSTVYHPYGQDIINYATFNCDALVVASAGNENNTLSFYPASFENTLSVAATTINDEKWTPENTGTSSGSSYGYHIDLSAPGTMMYTTDEGGYRTVYGGTSFSGPVVAGCAGIVKAMNPEYSALQLGEVLKNSCDLIDTIPANQEYAGLLGSGRVNLYKALTQDTLPAVVLHDIEISDDRENNYENSSIVEIGGIFTNYLADADNVTVSISTENTSINLLSGSMSLGNMESMTSVDITDDPIMFEITDDTQYDEQIILELEIFYKDTSRRQYIETSVKPSYKQIAINEISLSVPSNGRLGYVDLNRQIGMGMHYNYTEHLFNDCGILAGSSADDIASCIREVSEFETLEISSVVDAPETADRIIQSKFSVSNTTAGINLDIIQEIYGWQDQSDFLLSVYQLVNNNIVALNDYYFGIFTDWDLITYSQNQMRYDAESEISYAKYTGTESMFAAFQLISGHPENHYAILHVNGGDGLVDLSNGFNDSEKFYCLSNTNDTAGMNNDGKDVASVVSAGPMSIPAQDTSVLAFAIMAGQDINILRTASDSAKAVFERLFGESGSIGDISANTGIQVYPNPSTGTFKIHLPTRYSGSRIVLRDVSGRNLLQKMADKQVIEISEDLSSGIYIIEFYRDKMRISSQKLLISGTN